MKKKLLIFGVVIALLAMTSGTALAQFSPFGGKGESSPKKTYTLTVNIEPEKAGEVELSPAQPAKGYSSGTEVKLKAEPAEGYEFNKWTGDAWGADPKTSIIMTGDKEVTAHFKEITPLAGEEGKGKTGEGNEGKAAKEETEARLGGKEESTPSKGEEISLGDVKKSIPGDLKAQIEQLEKLRKQLERELETAKSASETKVKDMEVAGLLAKEAAKEAKAGNLDKAKALANDSIDLLVKTQKADREGAKTIEAYAKAIDDLAEAIEHLVSVMYGGA